MSDEVRQEQEPRQSEAAMDQDLVLPEEEQEGVKGGYVDPRPAWHTVQKLTGQGPGGGA